MGEATDRIQKRISKRIPVYFGPDDPDHLGFIKNISMGGIEISSRIVFEKETELSIRIHSKKDDVRARGVVRWVTDPKRPAFKKFLNLFMGVEFAWRSDNYVDFLYEVIDEDEHRRERRFSEVYKVTFLSPRQLMDEYTQNISLGGMFVVTDNPVKLGSDVEVRILIGQTLQVLHVHARVVHVVSKEQAEADGSNPGIGVQFVRFLDDHREILKTYVQELSARSD